MRIIIGLGNPGEKYKDTRHNVGFIAVDHLVNQLGLDWEQNKKFNSEIASLPLLAKERVGVRSNTLYAKPQTFMNNSGQAVQAILSYYKLLPKKFGLITGKNSDLSDILTVVHDDIDIELGKYKISTNSRSAGHRGVESIISHLKTKNFKRIRIGIRTKQLKNIPADLPRQNKMEAGKFVLQKLSQEELKIINKVIADITQSV